MRHAYVSINKRLTRLVLSTKITKYSLELFIVYYINKLRYVARSCLPLIVLFDENQWSNEKTLERLSRCE